MKDLLRTADLSQDDITNLVDLATHLRHHPQRTSRELAGELVVIYLTKPSTRSRVTFSAAAGRVGATVVVLGPTEFQLGYGAGMTGIARAVSLYAAVVVAHTSEHDLDQLAGMTTIPVVNSLSHHHQPCQGLADALTLNDSLGRLDRLRVAYVGDGRELGPSLMETCALERVQITVASQPGEQPDHTIVAQARTVATSRGGDVQLTNDPDQAVADADVVYLSLSPTGAPSNASPTGPHPTGRPHQTIDRLLAPAAPHAPLLVTQPARLTTGWARALIHHPRSLLRQQADNRLTASTAMLIAAHQGRLRGRVEPLTLATAS